MTYSLPSSELEHRQQAVRRILQQRGLAGLVLFHPVRIFYLINYYHLSTERPLAVIIPAEGEIAALVPALEDEYLAAQSPWVKRRQVYFEYPGRRHPMLHLADLIKSMGLAGKPLAADSDGHLDQNGYQGPALSTVLGQPLTLAGEITTNLRLVKSPAELDLLRQAGAWAARTHRRLKDSVTGGESETGISRRAEEQASDELKATLSFQGEAGGWASIHASFRSGARTSMPHARMGDRRIEPGDNLVTYCQGIVSGYYTELERTMFFGQPSTRQRELFEAVYAAQQIAFETLRPGLPCAAVDEKIQAHWQEHNLARYTLHHQGHGLGLEYHEAPFLDVGDETILQEGMVFSVEPGLYVPGLGGFRHSDTVALTSDGLEILTDYPRSYDDMVVKQG